MNRGDEHKELAIDTLESVTHWMKQSSFEYSARDLKDIFDKVISEYLPVSYTHLTLPTNREV